MLNPPSLLTPMAMRLGDYYLAIEKPRSAVDAYEEALEDFPNDQVTLDKLADTQKIVKKQVKEKTNDE